MKNRILQLVLLLSTATQPSLLDAQNHGLQLRSVVPFQDEQLAGIWGYVEDGREYALVAAAKGLKIVDVTEPDSPNLIANVEHPENAGGEIRTYRHFAYVSQRNPSLGGVMIVNLANLPDPNLPNKFYKGFGSFDVLNKFTDAHTIHIDTTAGFLYAFGGSPFDGAMVFDLKTDPWNPKYVGKFDDLGYIHDGFVDNDTLYAAHIYEGEISIVDMRDKANPVLLGTAPTPARFPHNTWVTPDRSTLFVTDEAAPSFLTAFDISDPTDIRELGRYTPSSKTIAHNTILLKDEFAVTSWYTAGLAVTDISKPENMVEVARYDTWPDFENWDYEGCWGVYPWLPSGTILATNIPEFFTLLPPGFEGELFILTPQFQRACYLEGSVKNACTGQPLKDVNVEIKNGSPASKRKTDTQGRFATGQSEAGQFQVVFQKAGYSEKVFDVVLKNGETIDLQVNMEPLTPRSVQAQVRKPGGLKPFGGFKFWLVGALESYPLEADSAGNARVDCVIGGEYCLTSGEWGWRLGEKFYLQNDTTLAVEPMKGYYDDFGVNVGWVTSPNESLNGWTWGKPKETRFMNQPINPGNDSPDDCNLTCFYTGEEDGLWGDYNTVIAELAKLTSPPIQLDSFTNPVLNFRYWSHALNPQVFGFNSVAIVSNNVQKYLTFFNIADSVWQQSGDIFLKNYITPGQPFQIFFSAHNPTVSNYFVEFAIDQFEIRDLPVSTYAPAARSIFSLRPNPAADRFRITFSENQPGGQLVATDFLGREIACTAVANATESTIYCSDWPPGVYYVFLKKGGWRSEAVRMLKF